MAEIDVDRKDNKGNNKKNTNWWIWAVVAIIAILVAWIAFDNRTDVQRDDSPAVNPTTFNNESGLDIYDHLAYTRIHRRK